MTKLCEYLYYSLPVDIRVVLTMADVDISHALATCLVRVGGDGEPVAGVARSWEFDSSGKFIDFYIDPKAKWSDGSSISVNEIIASFRDTKAHFQRNIPTVFESLTMMEEIAPATLRVHLVNGVDPNAFLGKLVAPAFGIVKLVNWAASVEVTSGPYSIRSVDEREMVLQVNPHWQFHSPDMISEIHLRRPDSFVTAATLMEDHWPDMINLVNGITKKELQKLPDGFAVLRLEEQRLLNLRYVGHDQLEPARALIGYLRAHADFTKIAELLEGGTLAKQVYPPSLALHGETPPTPLISREELLAAWKNPVIKIGYWQARLQPEIKEAFANLLREILPIKVEFIALQTLADTQLAREFELKIDFVFGSVGVTDQNWDGALSYYIEQEPIHFPSDRTANGNFIARLKAIRITPGDHIEAYRQLVYDVVAQNHFLPIAHFASVFVARPTIDFSQVPKFGVVVPLHSIRRVK